VRYLDDAGLVGRQGVAARDFAERRYAAPVMVVAGMIENCLRGRWWVARRGVLARRRRRRLWRVEFGSSGEGSGWKGGHSCGVCGGLVGFWYGGC